MLVKITILLLVITLIEGIPLSQGDNLTKRGIGVNCTTTLDCDPGLCCRDASGQILTSDIEGLLPLPAVENTFGTCSRQLGREGEPCDCGCRRGLECYRPLTGRCCAPMTCTNAAYVRKQREYWEKCFSDPTCPLPV
ncbi:hypothetical protein CHS0354_009918 [Potamilus streckersoni]|uniref:Uncharacterized protein n=1 Tax=Potamilus streckersoni TaxID=2493646 RepID=A0AAE0WC04_9BIVA|nr:hypothetical protein CHS0354_009918 [Potamilus streckersoni]